MPREEWPERVSHSYIEGADRKFVEVIYAALALCRRNQRLASIRQQFAAGFREVHVMAVAHEQCCAELSFESAYLLREGALRHADVSGRLREAQGLRNLDEII